MSRERIEIYLDGAVSEDSAILAARRMMTQAGRGRAQGLLRRALMLGLREMQLRGELPAQAKAVVPVPDPTDGSLAHAALRRRIAAHRAAHPELARAAEELPANPEPLPNVAPAAVEAVPVTTSKPAPTPATPPPAATESHNPGAKRSKLGQLM